MLEIMATSRRNLLEFRISGSVTEEDYRAVLIPALEDAIDTYENIRLLVRIESDFEDYTLGAIFEDARVGLKHWAGFDRIAVVADTSGITRAVRAFSVFMPCPVMLFDLSQEDEARRWLVESLGSIHQTDLGGGVLHVQLRGKLDAAVYAEEAQDMSAYARAHDGFRLLLDLRDFDGWQGIGALGQHFTLVRDHRNLVQKCAIVGTNSFEKAARLLARKLIKGDVRYFDADQLAEAKRWIAD
ncbi:STAS/SEC14 domain-containing protein [Puniceibacterium sp. IMCC21224]|uniref:STAS/SEC14 domain-containing protein n=1 Tax=Puniceibacterium sp. IMCC21224 TaxID=1618204 RepID=UPI00064D8B97|nr:STAS/SEC14 domain-containing protein [Puniceibacterium sp. IMCC21224]KMK66677.1 SpoIIAA [Puniceibacterium sp. IMCC21224]